MFQTLAKALRTQETEETVLVFDNYSNNQEFSLKHQERINRVTNGRYYKNVYVRKLPKMSQGKAYKQYLENTENKAELVFQNTRIKITNTQNVKYRMNSSESKTLFTSNHEEAETKMQQF